MKKNFFLSILFAAEIFFSNVSFAQNTFPSTGAAGIGTASPNSSSLLDITSTTKGVLVPRMTKAQRDAIVTLATGLLIYQTNNTPGFYYYSGTAWTAVAPKGVSKSLNNLTSPTAINVPLLPDANNTQDLGSNTNSWKNIYTDSTFYLDDVPFIASKNGDVLIGQNAGKNITTADVNTAVGDACMYNTTTGSNNTALGHRALYSNTGGFNNVAIAPFALYHSTGNNNHAIGYEALYENTTGASNIAIGYQTLQHNTTGNSNIAIGQAALSANTTISGLVAIGDSALYSSSAYNANGNTAIGKNAMKNNASGYQNTALGEYSLSSNVSGNKNTAIGSYALSDGATGGFNSATGVYALSKNTGSYNVANGYSALFYNTGSSNNAMGYEALLSNTSGNSNTALGSLSLESNTTGTYNTAVGVWADGVNVTGSYNACIGAHDFYFVGDFSNNITVGYDAAIYADNAARIGNSSVSSIGGQVTWTSFSDERIKTHVKQNVPGLSFINLLKPVTYHFSLAKENELLGNKNDTIEWSGKHDIEKINFTGFLAQDVDKAAKQINYDFSGVDKSGKIWGLRYAEFVVPLVKAVQELDSIIDSKDEQVKTLQSSDSSKQLVIANLQSENTDIKNQLESMKQQMQQFDQSLSLCCTSYKSSMANGNSSMDAPKLEQNIPNPFTRSTIVKFYIPQSASSAVIKIYSLAGVELKSFKVNQNGYGEISIAGNSLSSGVYAYTLIIDGNAIDTKQMILTK